MSRTLTVLTLVFSAIGGVVLIWYLAYGIDEKPPDALSLEGLALPTRIDWLPAGVVAIEAGNEADAYAALGFAQGIRRPWTVLFLRQAALGRLGEWFGATALSSDSLTRSLGLSPLAQKAYTRLEREEQGLLNAFAQGVNAALATDAANHTDRLVLLDVAPEPWEPWHTLAVERLLAWLATEQPETDSLAREDRDLRAFLAQDRALRTRLRLYGFEHGLAWSARDEDGPYMVQRHVYGATARPLFMEAVLRIAGKEPVTGGVLPGTPFFPAGRSGAHAWTVLLHSEARYRRAPFDASIPKTRYERLVLKDGSESLLPVYRDTTMLFPGTPDGPRAFALYWSGFRPMSDFGSWRALLNGSQSNFRIFANVGLLLDADGATHVLRETPYSFDLGEGVLVGQTPWSAFIAERLAADTSGISDPQSDPFSVWAERLAPSMAAALLNGPPLPDRLGEGLTYLQNWDFSYDASSIGGSIFDSWVRVYREATGRLPTPDEAPPDDAEKRLRLELFSLAMNELTERYGTDLSRWRWETVQSDTRYFTPWSVSGSAPDPPPPSFAPIRLSGFGHPSAPAWGPSPLLTALAGSASWEARISLGRGKAFRVRRWDLASGRFLGRYLLGNERPPPLELNGLAPEGVTRLIPGGP